MAHIPRCFRRLKPIDATSEDYLIAEKGTAESKDHWQWTHTACAEQEAKRRNEIELLLERGPCRR